MRQEMETLQYELKKIMITEVSMARQELMEPSKLFEVGPLNDKVLNPLEENEQYKAKLEQDIMQGFRDEVAITMRDLCKRVENQINQFKDMWEKSQAEAQAITLKNENAPLVSKTIDEVVSRDEGKDVQRPNKKNKAKAQAKVSIYKPQFPILKRLKAKEGRMQFDEFF
nr:hypothetical protein Iba_chr12aCG21240 [Ipomoea batatas]